MSVNEKMTAIADTIRGYTGGTAKLNLDMMCQGIEAVYMEGEDTGYAHGHEIGKQDEKERFRNGFSFNLNRYAFAGYNWNVNTFYPKPGRYVVANSHPSYMFAYHNYENEPYDLAQRLEDCGVTIATTGFVNCDYMFNFSNVTRIPSFDLSSFGRYSNTFNGCKNLVTIDSLTLSPTAVFTNTFTGCTSLVNLTISGEIGQSINLQESPLSVASMKSVIYHLVNYSGTDSEFAYTLYFSEDCWTALEADGPAIPNIDTEEILPEMSWRDYVGWLGWNA